MLLTHVSPPFYLGDIAKFKATRNVEALTKARKNRKPIILTAAFRAPREKFFE
jgi:hypothetical protein